MKMKNMIKVLAVIIIVQKQVQKKIKKSILIAPVDTLRVLVRLANWY
jgi:hypothetical protein